eukprot:GHVN01074367.1.p1 GENE.GHVN01074367.1~~GHVN01074367.1.p1  ORF type:complete len:1673 (+),score=319.89 GHVN01074367.1:201-5219(+)
MGQTKMQSHRLLRHCLWGWVPVVGVTEVVRVNLDSPRSTHPSPAGQSPQSSRSSWWPPSHRQRSRRAVCESIASDSPHASHPRSTLPLNERIQGANFKTAEPYSNQRQLEGGKATCFENAMAEALMGLASSCQCGKCGSGGKGTLGAINDGADNGQLVVSRLRMSEERWQSMTTCNADLAIILTSITQSESVNSIFQECQPSPHHIAHLIRWMISLSREQTAAQLVAPTRLLFTHLLSQAAHLRLGDKRKEEVMEVVGCIRAMALSGFLRRTDTQDVVTESKHLYEMSVSLLSSILTFLVYGTEAEEINDEVEAHHLSDPCTDLAGISTNPIIYHTPQPSPSTLFTTLRQAKVINNVGELSNLEAENKNPRGNSVFMVVESLSITLNDAGIFYVRNMGLKADDSPTSLASDPNSALTSLTYSVEAHRFSRLPHTVVPFAQRPHYFVELNNDHRRLSETSQPSPDSPFLPDSPASLDSRYSSSTDHTGSWEPWSLPLPKSIAIISHHLTRSLSRQSQLNLSAARTHLASLEGFSHLSNTPLSSVPSSSSPLPPHPTPHLKTAVCLLMSSLWNTSCVGLTSPLHEEVMGVESFDLWLRLLRDWKVDVENNDLENQSCSRVQVKNNKISYPTQWASKDLSNNLLTSQNEMRLSDVVTMTLKSALRALGVSLSRPTLSTQPQHPHLNGSPVSASQYTWESKKKKKRKELHDAHIIEIKFNGDVEAYQSPLHFPKTAYTFPKQYELWLSELVEKVQAEMGLEVKQKGRWRRLVSSLSPAVATGEMQLPSRSETHSIKQHNHSCGVRVRDVGTKEESESDEFTAMVEANGRDGVTGEVTDVSETDGLTGNDEMVEHLDLTPMVPEQGQSKNGVPISAYARDSMPSPPCPISPSSSRLPHPTPLSLHQIISRLSLLSSSVSSFPTSLADAQLLPELVKARALFLIRQLNDHLIITPISLCVAYRYPEDEHHSREYQARRGLILTPLSFLLRWGEEQPPIPDSPTFYAFHRFGSPDVSGSPHPPYPVSDELARSLESVRLLTQPIINSSPPCVSLRTPLFENGLQDGRQHKLLESFYSRRRELYRELKDIIRLVSNVAANLAHNKTQRYTAAASSPTPTTSHHDKRLSEIRGEWEGLLTHLITSSASLVEQVDPTIISPTSTSIIYPEFPTSHSASTSLSSAKTPSVIEMMSWPPSHIYYESLRALRNFTSLSPSGTQWSFVSDSAFPVAVTSPPVYPDGVLPFFIPGDNDADLLSMWGSFECDPNSPHTKQGKRERFTGRIKERIDAGRVDVVFIHGLRGSALRTWRMGEVTCFQTDHSRNPACNDGDGGGNGAEQKAGDPITRDDLRSGSPITSVAMPLRGEHGVDRSWYLLWPRRILSRDFPMCRVMAFDFNAPVFKEKVSLQSSKARQRGEIFGEGSSKVVQNGKNVHNGMNKKWNELLFSGESNPVAMSGRPNSWVRKARDQFQERLVSKVKVAREEQKLIPLQMGLLDIADMMLERLNLAQVGGNGRPVVLVGHSMGGLLIKIMMLKDPSFASQVKGIVFYGTPHFGSPLARNLRMFQPVVTPYAAELHPAQTFLSHLNVAFYETCVKDKKVFVASYGESLKTPLPFVKTKRFIVPAASADPGYGFYVTVENTDHQGLCKISSPEDIRYGALELILSYVVDEANESFQLDKNKT